jgi:hypothetical protein
MFTKMVRRLNADGSIKDPVNYPFLIIDRVELAHNVYQFLIADLRFLIGLVVFATLCVVAGLLVAAHYGAYLSALGFAFFGFAPSIGAYMGYRSTWKNCLRK